MGIKCSREAFEPPEGCPELNVDLEFPDFEACISADPSRLKGVSRLDIDKSPASPSLPILDDIPLHIEFPDMPPCPFGELREEGSSVTIKGVSGAVGGMTFSTSDGTGSSCSLKGIDLNLYIPEVQAPKLEISAGGVPTYSFAASSVVF